MSHARRSKLTDDVVAAMNPGIRKLVVWLRTKGFETINSGDGVTHDCCCDPPFPFVAMEVEPHLIGVESKRLYRTMRRNGVPMVNWSKVGHGEAPEEDSPDIQVEYQPSGREYALIVLVNVLDKHLPFVKGVKRAATR